MADISKITLLDGVTYDIKDSKARMVILSYGHSTWNDFITAYNTNTVMYCRASSNSNPASGSQTRLAFMAYVNDATSPTNVEFQYYRSVNAHSESQQGDQMYVYKLTSAGTWSVTVRESYTKITTGNGLNKSYSSGVLTLSSSVYESKTAASGGTDLSLVTTGEKYAWNNKLSSITSSDVTTALGYTPPQTDTNTHRPIKVNGTQVLGDNTTALNLAAGTNVTLSESSGTVTISSSDTNTHRPIKVDGAQVLGDNTTALDLVAGTNVTLSESSGAVTISATDTTYNPASSSTSGLMSSTDKAALDDIYDLVYGSGGNAYPTNLVDLALSSTSEKPLANRIIYNLITDCAVNWRIDDESGLVYLVNRFGDDIGDSLDIIGSKTYKPSIINLLNDRTITIGQGSTATLQYSYSSVDINDVDDGPGTGVIIVNGVSTQSFTVPQGSNSYNVTSLLSPGENSVKVRITNSEGTSRELSYIVILLSLTLTTTLVTPNAYDSSVTFDYILSGYGSSKTVHFEMDGTELTSDTISTSGVTTTKVLAAQSAGVHTFRIWATTTVNNVSVTSDTLVYSMIWATASLPDISVSTGQYAIRYFNYDGTYLYGYAANSGAAAINPVTQELISAPTKSGTSDITYTFSGWADLPASVSKDCAVLAQYTTSYRVIFMNGSDTFDTQWIVSGNNATNPSTSPTKAEDNDYAYTFAGWTTTSGGTSVEANALTNVTAARTVYAVYTTTNKYTVRFMNGTTVLQTSRVVAGSNATYTGTEPTSSESGFVFNGWLPSPNNIQADTDCMAQFLDTNTEVSKFFRRTHTSYESVASS